jgi:hypothetical protein
MHREFYKEGVRLGQVRSKACPAATGRCVSTVLAKSTDKELLVKTPTTARTINMSSSSNNAYFGYAVVGVFTNKNLLT